MLNEANHTTRAQHSRHFTYDTKPVRRLDMVEHTDGSRKVELCVVEWESVGRRLVPDLKLLRCPDHFGRRVAARHTTERVLAITEKVTFTATDVEPTHHSASNARVVPGNREAASTSAPFRSVG